MDEIVSTLLEGLLHQKEQLELTIEELNQFEKAYGKDSKITQDRLDKLSVDLDKISQDIETLKSIKPETIDLSKYATLDDIKEVKDGIDGKDGANGKDGIDGINGVDGRDGKDGINGTNGVDGKDGLNGINGKDGKNGIDGTNGIGIDTITYKNNTLYITLTDGTKKEFKLPVQYVGGGGYLNNTTTDDTLKNRAELEGLYKVAFTTAYSELTYIGADISEINIWDTNLKSTLLFTKSLTYVNGNITQINITDHLQGVTLTKELSYNMGNIISINKVIT